jgi:hypothetical protein
MRNALMWFNNYWYVCFIPYFIAQRVHVTVTISPSIRYTVVMRPKERHQGKHTIKASGTKAQEQKQIIISNLKEVIKYHAGDKIEKIEMGGACSTYGGGERCVQGSGGET